MDTLLITYYQVTTVILLVIGLYMVIVSPNLIKKILGLHIMETSVFLFLISLGKLQGGTKAPILMEVVEIEKYVNPVPHHLVILGVLLTLGVTSFALILIIKIFNNYNTLNCNKLRRMI